MNKYDDIINLPHHISKKYPQMEKESRAAQFAPFAALAGYEDAVEETARITDSRIELDEEMKVIINEKLNVLDINISNKPKATFTYFVPDKTKSGGRYITITDNVRKIDLINNEIILLSKNKIKISDLIGISGV